MCITGGSGSACFGGLRRNEGIANRQLMVLVFGLLWQDEGITGGGLKFDQIDIGRQQAAWGSLGFGNEGIVGWGLAFECICIFFWA